MRLRATALLLILSLAACATKPPAPAAPTQAEWQSISAADFSCKPGEFTTVEFADIAGHPEHYYEKCVRLRALLSNNVLIKDASSLHAVRPDDRKYEGMVGFFLNDDKRWNELSTHPQFVLASGRLRSCADRQKQTEALNDRARAADAATHKSGDGIHIFMTMMSGFCHYSGGPALYVNDVTAIPTAMD